MDWPLNTVLGQNIMHRWDCTLLQELLMKPEISVLDETTATEYTTPH